MVMMSALFFLVEGMFRTSCSAFIFIGTIGIVRYFVHRRWDWCEGIWIHIHSEEPIDWLWTRTEQKAYSIGRCEQCVWAHQHMWNNSSIRDSSMGIPWIGSGAKGSPAFMSAREVSIAVDMVTDV